MSIAKRVRWNYRKDLYGVVSLALCIFFAISLFSYNPTDPGLNVSTNIAKINNLGGLVGAYTADALLFIFGISAYFLCAVLLLISILQFLGKDISINWKEAVAYAILVICAAAMIHLYLGTIHVANKSIEGGGLLGNILAKVLRSYLNTTGAYVITGALFLMALLYGTHISAGTVLRGLKTAFLFMARHIAQFLVIYFNRLKRHLPRAFKAMGKSLVQFKNWLSKKKTPIKINISKIEIPGPKLPVTAFSQGLDNKKTPPIKEPKTADEVKAVATEKIAKPPPKTQPAGPRIFDRADTRRKAIGDDQLELTHISKDYVFPSLSLLDSGEQKTQTIDEEALKKNAILLENKLKDYEVEGKVTEIHPGPVITMYEFEPAPGVKVNKIIGLEDDLSVAMGGRSIRTVAHLPGKAAIGIEIPNNDREIVWLKDIIGDLKFKKSQSKLTFALGKNTEGNPVVADLTKMPHLLIAGATGSGKSVAINSMICSLLYKAKPDEVRLILVDPKMLELPIYEGIPHLLLPVVTKVKDTVLALQWALREMERRYKVLSDVGARNIADYNAKIEKGEIKLIHPEEAAAINEADKEAILHTGRLPFIVIIIDELADLMMMAPHDMEETITRLAQMARAAGIHLTLATQRPSVDVITGLIKANFPARISFKVSAKHDSRTIIDTVGAEKLLGMGDMLFMPPSSSNLIRIHGAYVTDTEITRIVDHVKSQATAHYDESILIAPQKEGLYDVDGEYDELYDQAVALVAETKQASISMIQRRLRIGYNRAARMIERMEAEGVVGPPDGAKPREVLINPVESE